MSVWEAMDDMSGADNIVDMADMDNMAGIDNMDATDKKKQNIRILKE